MRSNHVFLAVALTIVVLLPHSTGATASRRSHSQVEAVPGVLRRVKTLRRVVALTFDACQTRRPAGYDAKIVAILRRTHTPATLMLGGRWAETHPAITRELGRDPLFEVGNHSYLHPHMTRVSEARARDEIARTQDVIFRLIGRRPTLFRPPYGEVDGRLVHTATSLGVRTMLWDVVSGDPDPHVSAAAMTREILARSRPGSIVIMHVNGRGWHTAEALPGVINGLRKRGFELVTVSTMLNSRRSQVGSRKSAAASK